MPAPFSALRSAFSQRPVREFLWWCLPALIIGLALRIWLTVDMPYAFYHDDTPDFLTTPDQLLHHGKFELHEKKTFLVPILFTLPFLTGLPALIVIPIAQHLMGLMLVALVGLLCRLWFRHWRVFIVPITVLVAINPALLWYEHTLMAEAIFLFTTVLVTLAGTLYVLEQTRGRFIFLLVALFLEAGARPEGKLFFGFGILLLLVVHFRAWRLWWPRLAIMLALAVLTHFVTRTSQGGLLLYTSVARLTPTNLNCAPGFDPYIAPLRADLQQRWAMEPSFPKVRDRRMIAQAVRQYLKDHNAERTRHTGVNAFCLRLAKETCLRNLAYLPVYAFYKFRSVSTEEPSGSLDLHWIMEKQLEAFAGSPRSFSLSKGLTGVAMTNKDEFRRFLKARYQPVAWFNAWQDQWQEALNFLTVPPQHKAAPLDDAEDVATLHPVVTYIPLYFVVAALGIIAVALRRGELQRFHLVWGLVFAGFFFIIMLTANVRPRFRFVFEPYWFIYMALLLECGWLLIARGVRSRRLS